MCITTEMAVGRNNGVIFDLHVPHQNLFDNDDETEDPFANDGGDTDELVKYFRESSSNRNESSSNENLDLWDQEENDASRMEIHNADNKNARYHYKGDEDYDEIVKTVTEQDRKKLPYFVDNYPGPSMV